MNSPNTVPIVAKKTTRDSLKNLKYDFRVDSLDEVIRRLIEEHYQKQEVPA
jgi:hypothetical protein